MAFADHSREKMPNQPCEWRACDSIGRTEARRPRRLARAIETDRPKDTLHLLEFYGKVLAHLRGRCVQID